MPELTPEELRERLADGDDIHVLDIREEDSYEQVSIEGSHHAPVYEDLKHGDPTSLREAAADIPEDAEVATVCIAGVVAQAATDVLRQEGYDAKTLAGGMRGWLETA